MLGHATNEIVGHADVKRASDAIGEYIDVEAAWSHRPALGYGVARSRPGDDTSEIYSPACSLRGSGNSSGAPVLTMRAVSAGRSGLLTSSSSMRPARFSV